MRSNLLMISAAVSIGIGAGLGEAVPHSAPVSAAEARRDTTDEQTGAGLEGLCRQLAAWLVPDEPAPGAAVPFTPALCEAVEEAYRLCLYGRLEEAAHRLKRVV